MNKNKVSMIGVIVSTVIALAIFGGFLLIEEQFTKIFYVLVFLIVVAPVMLNYLGNVVIAKLKAISYLQQKNNITPQEIQEPKKIEIKKETNVIKYPDVKPITNEEYDNLRTIFRAVLKSKSMNRNDIIAFDKEIDSRLGEEFADKYNRYKCENDIHRIYVKIRCPKFTNEDYIHLQYWLECLAEKKAK